MKKKVYLLYKKLGFAVLYVAYVRRVLLYVYRGVLYVYSPPCTLPPQKQEQERIVKTPDKSDKCDRNDNGIGQNQGPLYEAKNN
jgi:hypothetical protein